MIKPIKDLFVLPKNLEEQKISDSKEYKIDAINLIKEQGYSCSEASKTTGSGFN